MDHLNMYKKIFQDLFGVEDAALDETFNFKDIEAWDSLTHLSLISELEAAFDVMFETEDILHFGGYLNGMEILKRYGVSFES